VLVASGRKPCPHQDSLRVFSSSSATIGCYFLVPFFYLSTFHFISSPICSARLMCGAGSGAACALLVREWCAALDPSWLFAAALSQQPLGLGAGQPSTFRQFSAREVTVAAVSWLGSPLRKLLPEWCGRVFPSCLAHQTPILYLDVAHLHRLPLGALHLHVSFSLRSGAVCAFVLFAEDLILRKASLLYVWAKVNCAHADRWFLPPRHSSSTSSFDFLSSSSSVLFHSLFRRYYCNQFSRDGGAFVDHSFAFLPGWCPVQVRQVYEAFRFYNACTAAARRAGHRARPVGTSSTQVRHPR
jgi:hypothetical protein